MHGSRTMFYLVGSVALIACLTFGWRWAAGAGYESADYTVAVADGKFEIREYPELTVAKTNMKSYGNGSDGSFMRLFRYISGDNEAKQKVAMTTPVFMEAETEASEGRMAFVVPQDVAADSVPVPSGEAVEIDKRPAGKYAVLRFSGRMSQASIQEAEAKLREWIEGKELEAESEYEFAGYDPPWTPGPLRRNEVLIRVK